MDETNELLRQILAEMKAINARAATAARIAETAREHGLAAINRVVEAFPEELRPVIRGALPPLGG